MNEIKFFVPGIPQALKRHRTYRHGAININVDPSAQAKDSFLSCSLKFRPEKPLDSMLKVQIGFYFPRPKSHYNSKGHLKPQAPIFHTSRPDIDNLSKFILDSLNGVFWKDDSIICEMSLVKLYRDQSGIFISINEAKIIGE